MTPILRLCSAPGCANLQPETRCAVHRRPSAAKRGYGRRWREDARAAFLRLHPHCEDCGAQATVADHVPLRRELMRLGVPDPDADRFLHARCARCHNRRTGRGA